MSYWTNCNIAQEMPFSNCDTFFFRIGANMLLLVATSLKKYSKVQVYLNELIRSNVPYRFFKSHLYPICIWMVIHTALLYVIEDYIQNINKKRQYQVLFFSSLQLKPYRMVLGLFQDVALSKIGNWYCPYFWQGLCQSVMESTKLQKIKQ